MLTFIFVTLQAIRTRLFYFFSFEIIYSQVSNGAETIGLTFSHKTIVAGRIISLFMFHYCSGSINMLL
nr:MAG TPA: hypothetical protein [Bacteriophage sp.]